MIRSINDEDLADLAINMFTSRFNISSKSSRVVTLVEQDKELREVFIKIVKQIRIAIQEKYQVLTKGR